MKRALITGITGQDGAYLARFLIKKGYKVFGTYRRLSTPNFWRLHNLQIFDKVELIPGDIIDSGSVALALEKSNPHEIYHLAAQSFVDVSFNQPLYTGNMTGFGCVRILEQLNKFNSKINITYFKINFSPNIYCLYVSIKHKTTRKVKHKKPLFYGVF